jgi:hypothetical protein
MPFRPLRDHRFGLDPFAALSHDRERFSDPAPLADFCNHKENKGTPGERRFLARSSPFRRSPLHRAFLEPALLAARHSRLSPRAGVRRRRRTGRTATSQLARSGAEADSIPSEHPMSPAALPRAFGSALGKRASQGPLSPRRANVRDFHEPRCFRPLEPSRERYVPRSRSAKSTMLTRR